MVQSNDLAAYYAERAPEYDRVYDKPERQGDIATLGTILAGLLAGHEVLEVACGTGYWTRVIAPTARRILATDINDQVLAIARERLARFPNVLLQRDDAYSLGTVEPGWSAGFAGFWWSHVPRSELSAFLEIFHSKLRPGALVVFTDNRFVEGSNHPVTRTDEDGNTYQRRRLVSGAEFEVLKNFPTESDIRSALGGRATDPKVRFLNYYWCVSYLV